MPALARNRGHRLAAYRQCSADPSAFAVPGRACSLQKRECESRVGGMTRFAILALPVLAAILATAGRWRDRAVPVVVFALGTGSVAGWAVLRHARADNQIWFYLVFPSLLALPPLAVWLLWRSARGRRLDSHGRIGRAWLISSVVVGAIGVWAALGTLGAGVP